ncbi:hypothetical protein N9W11_00080 [Psychrosphaera haliotis]|nr:hypothetical protein [Psychrosphaera haliotis]
MASKCLIIFLISLLVGCAERPYVDIYYDGFWTKHRVYQNEQGLVDEASLKLLNAKLSDLPNEAQKLIFDGYSTIEGAEIPQDIIFMLMVTDKEGQIIHKIIGDSIYLYDPSRDKFKRLSDKEKNYLRCLFYETSTEPEIPAKVMEYCKS